jgi:hypothetical protein
MGADDHVIIPKSSLTSSIYLSMIFVLIGSLRNICSIPGKVLTTDTTCVWPAHVCTHVLGMKQFCMSSCFMGCGASTTGACMYVQPWYSLMDLLWNTRCSCPGMLRVAYRHFCRSSLRFILLVLLIDVVIARYL